MTTNIDRLKPILQSFSDNAMGLLPALHAVQAEFGFIDPDFNIILADEFNLSLAEIKGVVSFYHDFKSSPQGRHTLRLCRAEACQAQGANALIAFAENLTGLKVGETDSDGFLSLDAVYCLGLCASGPAIDIDGKAMARVSEDDLGAALLGFKGEKKS
jgi:formate dehydrogenase subunit gamma